MGEKLENIVNTKSDEHINRRGFLGILAGFGLFFLETSCSPLTPIVEHLPVIGLNLVEVDNFFYRTGQVDPEDLNYLKSKYGIETVLILRGEHQEEAWYREELIACQNLGIGVQAFAFSARYPSEPNVYLDFIDALEENKHKVKLVHCKSGCERTALASALYILLTGGNLDDAREQLRKPHSYLRKNSYIPQLIREIWNFVSDKSDREAAMKEYFASEQYLEFYNTRNPDAKLTITHK